MSSTHIAKIVKWREDFIMATVLCIKMLLKWLVNMKTNIKPKKSCKLYFVILSVLGYSMGASLAAHATAALIVNGHRVHKSYLYGLYRIGNRQFSQWLDKVYMDQSESGKGKIIRITHHKDPVPHLPPSSAGY